MTATSARVVLPGGAILEGEAALEYAREAAKRPAADAVEEYKRRAFSTRCVVCGAPASGAKKCSDCDI